MNSLLLRLFFTAIVAIAIGSCSTQYHRFPVQRYVPITRAMEALGELHLSNSLMRFAALEGEMKLEYVGQMPEAAGEDLAGASVYRVKNWRPYFKQNSGKPAYCAEPPRWVTVNSKTGAHAWSTEISIGLLSVEDWKKFSSTADRSCVAGTYVRTPE